MNQDTLSSKPVPGADFLADAEAHRAEGRLVEAKESLFAGLSHEPDNHIARLALARIFYEQGQYPFAERELMELRQKLPENEAIVKLLERMAPELATEPPAVPVKTVAAAEFDLDDLDD